MHRIVTREDSIQLNLIVPIYKTKLVRKKGEEYPEERQVLQKEKRVRQWLRKDAIAAVREYLNARNEVCPNRCIVFDRYTGQTYVVNHSLDAVWDHISPVSYTSIGFNINDRRTKVKKTG